ncbi:MAG: DUF1722 domain-containing protein [Acidobacteriota bacterium]|nr:DUF1722 domain-containing protein [Acidobacteriota bacterium]
MRIWDIDPGYLNNGSLLAEHRELHALLRVAEHGRGPADHPEFKRWQHNLPALACRHGLLVAEMELRGYGHRSPVPQNAGDMEWPENYLTEPAEQYNELARRYLTREPGRIPFPKRATDMWAAHKYSVMARDPGRGRQLGRDLAEGRIDEPACARLLVSLMRRPPHAGRLRDALLHMWGYVSDRRGDDHENLDNRALLTAIRRRAAERNIIYLLQATALGELAAWL